MKRPPRFWFWKIPVEQEIDEEIAFHLEMHTRDLIARGMSPAAARDAAASRLGDVPRMKHTCVDIGRKRDRKMRLTQWLDELRGDVTLAIRQLRRTPGFTLVAVLTLVLGIGANTAIFSLVSAVLLRPLPFPDPDRLMVLLDDASAIGGPPRTQSTPADYAAWNEQSRSFTGIAGMHPVTYNLTGSGEPQKLTGVRTTANLFTLLGMQALVGRTLLPADDQPDANAVVVLNERTWRSLFGADPGVVGRTILLNGLPHVVVGIVPSEFQFPVSDAALWVPARFTPRELAVRQAYFMEVIARLKPDVSLPAAQAEMTAIAQRLAREFPSNKGINARVVPLHEQLTGSARPAMAILFGAVVLVLLIACVNVANLLLSRAASRQKELALRKALGAADTRVVRQLLTESAVLAATGATIGIALSTFTFRYLARLVPGGLPAGTEPALNVSVLLFSAAVTSLVVLAFGAGPAIVASRVALNAVLKTGSARATSGAGTHRVRNALVVAEISLTLVLLVAAGLLLRSYANVLAVPPGFEASHLLIAETVLSPSKYGTTAARSAFYGRVLERVRAMPSVTGAGYVNYAPLTFPGGRALFPVEGEPPPTQENFTKYLALDRFVTPGYLQALGVPLVRGRHLDERDREGAPVAVVVNEQFVTAHWPNKDPLGKRIRFGAPDTPWMTVVGVVGNMRQLGLDMPVEPEVYWPADQVAAAFPFMRPQQLIVRTTGDPMTLAASVRRAVSEIDPNQPVSNVRSMEQLFAASVLDRNTQMTLMIVFAALALVMASVGLYGVLSYTVTRRLPEIGVRMALGAQRATVVRDIIRGALLLAVSGIVLGAAGAFAATRLLSASLFNVSRVDPATFAVTGVLVLVMSLVASAVPAFRGAGVDPSITLRNE